MKKYRYVEFVDGMWNEKVSKQGRLYLVAEKPETYIEEFSLSKTGTGYYTTLEKIGELGWQLEFVTPYNNIAGNQNCMLWNAYVFKKEID